jgi:hypothetical protein
MNQNKPTFINNTQLDDKEAGDLLDKMRTLFLDSEDLRQSRIERAERAMRIWKGELWDEVDLAAFEKLGMTPYVFRQYRTMLNSLINRQRSRRFTYELVPNDIHAFRRMRDGRDAYIAENRDYHTSDDEAGEYFDKYADDEYAKVITGALQHHREVSKAKWAESEVFEQGIVTGLAFAKAIYSNRYHRDGGVEIEAVPQRKMIFDQNSVRYDMSDCEYIGETHLLYKDDLKLRYPQWSEEIEKNYKRFTNIGNDYRTAVDNVGYSEFYKSDTTNDKSRIRLNEVWTKKSEDRIKVIDQNSGEVRIAAFGLSEEDIWDGLYQVSYLDLIKPIIRAGEENPEILEQLEDPSIADRSKEVAQERFVLEVTQEPVWYKTVFTFDAMWEHERSPFLHGSHPYTPFYAQHTDGYFTGLMDDVADIIIAFNKAMMFREMIFAQGAKGLVVVDADSMTQSGYDIDDIAEAYTQIGGILVMKTKNGKTLDNTVRQINTTGQGLQEINNLINDYANRLEYILGVNRAQLGMSSADAPASRYRMEVAEGESNNGIIIDNFVRSIETFYNDKVVPLVVEWMRANPNKVVRVLGDGAKSWLQMDLGEDLDVFADSVRTGEYTLVMKPVEDNPQISASRSAQYFQLALNGLLPLETALEFSDDPNREKIVMSMKKHMVKKAAEQAAAQVTIQQVQQIALEMGIPPEAAAQMVSKLQLGRMKELEASQKQQPQMVGGNGMSEIQAQSAESPRLQTIENNTLTQ